MDLTTLAVVFGSIFIVELPDKTLVATLVLTTRYRAWPVFVGVCVAFLVQCVIAVSFGSVLTLLPERITAGIVTVLFAVGAFMLLREGFGAEEDSEQERRREEDRPQPRTDGQQQGNTEHDQRCAGCGDSCRRSSSTHLPMAPATRRSRARRTRRSRR